MIIKGGSRAGPVQLAWHLQRRDTNEKVDILELQSPAENLKEAFRDWQTLTEGTRGFKGLYHANIDPAKDYVMTPEQWNRAVDILEEELKLKGQPRAVVMHEKHGRQHIHVVWARTDIDRMVLFSDSQNYMAHERASQRLEQEFGHEEVPGKHAKRDRKKQPDFPKAIANQAEWQQGERTGIDPAARKEQITALKQACDNGQTFKTALEEHAYILAKGDRRDFVIVDETGNAHSLGRQIQGMKAAELRAFMKDVDREALPTANEAVELQRARQEEALHDQAVGAPPEDASAAHEDHRQPHTEQLSPTEIPKQPAEPAAEAQTPKTDSETTPDPFQVQTEALRKALAERQAEEQRGLVETHTAELGRLRDTAARDTRRRLERFDALQREETEALLRRQAEARSGVGGLFDSVRRLFSSSFAREREAAQNRQRDELARRQKEEREAFVARLEEASKLESDNVSERHTLQRQAQEAKAAEELDRHLREREATRALREEYEQTEREEAEETAREENLRDATDERPPPKRAR